MTEQEWAEGFDGAPFEGMGNIWDAIMAGGFQTILQDIDTYLGQAELLQEKMTSAANGHTIAYLEYPADGAARMNFIIEVAGEKNNLVSACPIFEGQKNTLSVLNFKSWENGIEGNIAFATLNTGDIGVFDPYYAFDATRLQKGMTCVCNVAALLFKREMNPVMELTIKKGALYEMGLADFLKEYPGKTEADYPGAKVRMEQARSIMPTSYTGEYHLRAPVEQVEALHFLNEPLYRFKLTFGDDEPDEGARLCLWAYATPFTLGENVPSVGDVLEGYFWLSGFLGEGEKRE